METNEGDPVLTGAVADALLSQPVVASASAAARQTALRKDKQSERTPNPKSPFSAALGLAAALCNLLRVGVLWCVCVLAFQ